MDRFITRLGVSDSIFLGGNPPFQPTANVTGGSVDNPGGTSTNLLPLTVTTQSKAFRNPEAWNWNMTVERQLPWATMVSVGYVGRRGLHLQRESDINQPTIATVLANPGIALDALRPYKGYNSIRETDNVGQSIFNSLQIAARPAQTIAGSAACKPCHDEDCRTWKKSKHAAAWKALVDKDAQFNPDCQRCHVTGYGEPGGFQTVRGTPQRVGVGCESCHGMSLEHWKKTSTRTQLAEQSKDRCRRCHDRENSPKFDYETYWAKIQHGKPATVPEESPTAESSEESP